MTAAIDGTARRLRCLLGLLGCPEETSCVLHSYWKRTRLEILDQLPGVTVENMHRHHDPGGERGLALRNLQGDHAMVGVAGPVRDCLRRDVRDKVPPSAPRPQAT